MSGYRACIKIRYTLISDFRKRNERTGSFKNCSRKKINMMGEKKRIMKIICNFEKDGSFTHKELYSTTLTDKYCRKKRKIKRRIKRQKQDEKFEFQITSALCERSASNFFRFVSYFCAEVRLYNYRATVYRNLVFKEKDLYLIFHLSFAQLRTYIPLGVSLPYTLEYGILITQ